MKFINKYKIMSKSFTTLEQYMCPVTGKSFDSGNLLIYTRMKDIFEMKTVTQWAICPEVTKMFDEGYIALVVIDDKKSDIPKDGSYPKPQDVFRTGEILYLKKEKSKDILGQKIESFCWIDQKAADMLKDMVPKENNN